jgi:uncharacterized protein (DUF4415 family)
LFGLAGLFGVWDDPHRAVLPDGIEDGKPRWHAVCIVGPVALLLIVHANLDPQDEDRIRMIGARKAIRREGSSMRKGLSRAQLNQLAKIGASPDDQTHTIDVPEAPVENSTEARRGGFYRPVKQSVTIRLDADIIAWFKQHAPNGRYQTEINRTLRQYVIATEKQRT